MSQLEETSDLLGTSSQTDLTSQDVGNVIDELNRSNASVNRLGQVLNIANILNVSYTFTDDDFNNGYANIPFPHGLSFVPIVNGSIGLTTDDSIRILPAFYHDENGSYFDIGEAFSASVVIESVDSTNVNIRVDMMDGVGLSLFIAEATLTFILYCQQQIAATT